MEQLYLKIIFTHYLNQWKVANALFFSLWLQEMFLYLHLNTGIFDILGINFKSKIIQKHGTGQTWEALEGVQFFYCTSRHLFIQLTQCWDQSIPLHINERSAFFYTFPKAGKLAIYISCNVLFFQFNKQREEVESQTKLQLGTLGANC